MGRSRGSRSLATRASSHDAADHPPEAPPTESMASLSLVTIVWPMSLPPKLPAAATTVARTPATSRISATYSTVPCPRAANSRWTANTILAWMRYFIGPPGIGCWAAEDVRAGIGGVLGGVTKGVHRAGTSHGYSLSPRHVRLDGTYPSPGRRRTPAGVDSI